MKKTIILSLITLALVPALTTSSAQAMEWNSVKSKVKSAMPVVASRVRAALPWAAAGSMGYAFGWFRGAKWGLPKGVDVGKRYALDEAKRKVCGAERKECSFLLSAWADLDNSDQQGTPAEKQAWDSLQACQEPYTKACYHFKKRLLIT